MVREEWQCIYQDSALMKEIFIMINSLKFIIRGALAFSLVSLGILIQRGDEADLQYILHDKFDNQVQGASYWNVGSKLDRFIFGRDFGVIPNDGLDDSIALQKAIDYVGSNGGGTIHLSGEIDVSQTIFLNKNSVKIQGTGMIEFENYSGHPEGTVIKAIGGNWANWQSVLHVGKSLGNSALKPNVFGVGLKDLSIIASGATGSLPGQCIDIENVQHSQFENISVFGMKRIGIRLRDSDNKAHSQGTKYNIFSNIFIHARDFESKNATGLKLEFSTGQDFKSLGGGVFKNTFIGLRINHQDGHGIHITGGDGNIFLSPFVWKNTTGGDLGDSLFFDPPTNKTAINNQFFYPIVSSVNSNQNVIPPVRIWLYGLNFSSDNNGSYPIFGNSHNLYVSLENGEYPGRGWPTERRFFIPAKNLDVKAGNPSLSWIGNPGKEVKAFHLQVGNIVNGSFLFKKGQVSFGEPPKVFAWVRVVHGESYQVQINSGAYSHGMGGNNAQSSPAVTINDIGKNYVIQKVFVGFLTNEIKKTSAFDDFDNDDKYIGVSLKVLSGSQTGFDLLGMEIVKRGD